MGKSTVMAILMAMARFGAFALVAAFLAGIARARTEKLKQRGVVALVAYIVLLHLGVAFTRERDLWPFSAYRLAHGRIDFSWPLWRIGFFGVDARGREWRIDPYAWESMSDWHLQWWFYRHYDDQLSDKQKRAVLRMLYNQGERQRSFIARHHRGPWRSIFGPLTAPQLWMFPRELSVPQDSYRSLRVYYEEWSVNGRLAGRNPTRIRLGEWTAR